MAPGFLAALSQPSSQLPLEEFHAWYEEEHIPLRLNYLPSFLTGARYHAVEDKGLSDEGPGWIAIYDIDDKRSLEDKSYTNLRKNRSEREESVIGRLEVLARITAEVVGVWGAEEGETGGLTTGLKLGKPSGCVVTHNLEVDGENGVEEWARELTKEAGKVEGWVRLRVTKVLDSGKTKMGVAVNLDEGEVGRYFVVHEFEKVDPKATDSLRELATFEKVRVGGWRVWKLYKAYPSIAQGNVVGSTG